MLERTQRLTNGREFARTVRRGQRSGTTTVVVHLATTADSDQERGPARAGLVVGKAVGNAVVRNRVKRRLRHLVRAHLADLPGGAVLVLRALPPAAEASSAQLAADLDRALRRLTREGVRS